MNSNSPPASNAHGGIHYGSSSSSSSSDPSENIGNVLVLSLYLIDSEEDILPELDAPKGTCDDSKNSKNSENSENVYQRARLYQRLCDACAIANHILRSASFGTDHTKSTSSTSGTNRDCLPWSCGGDGPIFGIHCNLIDDEFLNASLKSTGILNGDEHWQFQSQSPNAVEKFLHIENYNRGIHSHGDNFQQPHLRAICRYGNDVADMWRCISLAFRISSVLSSSSSQKNMQCAIEAWDVRDGHVLLIEAANQLPSWVDDDVLQGGVGGPEGCRNRCWIMNGKVHLIPPLRQLDPSFYNVKDDVDPGDGSFSDAKFEYLLRRDALSILLRSSKRDGIRSVSLAPEAVQDAIQNRLNRVCYSLGRSSNNPQVSSIQKKSESRGNNIGSKNRHWHIAAAALPATVARFVEEHPFLVPLLVDSFCQHAPTYMKEKASKKQTSTNNNGWEKHGEANESNSNSSTDNQRANPHAVHEGSKKHSSTLKALGKEFPYEQIVILPITFTRTNYAELITGRGTVPSFPIPPEYRSVELNRFQRQLRQQAFGGQMHDLDTCAEGPGGAGYDRAPGTKNRFHRAVDIGVRMCAGLDWIFAACGNQNSSHAMDQEESAVQTLGEIERRLRIYWTRVDAEASSAGYGRANNAQSIEVSNAIPTTSLSWIEQAWQAGPSGSNSGNETCDQVLVRTLQSMSKCQVFYPELSKPLRDEPCPSTRPNLSLREIAKSGIRRALKWHREAYHEDYFAVPRVWEVDDDGWMEVNSLEELEAEMKNVASSNSKTNATTAKRDGPRRTTRRSRRKLHQSQTAQEGESRETEDDDVPSRDDRSVDTKSLNKVLDGFQRFIEGQGELEGAVTKNEQGEESDLERKTPKFLMEQKVSINPGKFINLLHGMMKDPSCMPGSDPSANLKLDEGTLGGNLNTRYEDNEEDCDGADGQDVSKYFFEEDLIDSDASVDSDSSNGTGAKNNDSLNHGNDQQDELHENSYNDGALSMKNIMQMMDHELRTNTDADQSIKHLSIASEEIRSRNEKDSVDSTVMLNFLSSLDSEVNGTGPVSNILREMGICPPR